MPLRCPSQAGYPALAGPDCSQLGSSERLHGSQQGPCEGLDGRCSWAHRDSRTRRAACSTVVSRVHLAVPRNVVRFDCRVRGYQTWSAFDGRQREIEEPVGICGIWSGSDCCTCG